MGFLSKLFGNKEEKVEELVLKAYMKGKVVDITEVPDPVFAQKMMGDGFAVEPANGNIVSPVSGTVSSIFPTKHALGLVTEAGLEVLVHIGLDTVSLEGKPFTVHVAEGQKLQQVIFLSQLTWMLSVQQVVKLQQWLSSQMLKLLNQLN